MKKPNNVVEVFLSLVKWFLLVLLLNNAIWAFVYVVSKTSDETTIEQGGQNNNLQGVNNGTINQN